MNDRSINLLENYVNKTPFLRLTAKFNSALEALPVLSAHPVELLFLDIQMPELSGVETARQIRAAIGHEAAIIILTAYDWTDIEEEAKAAGVTAFIPAFIWLAWMRMAR